MNILEDSKSSIDVTSRLGTLLSECKIDPNDPRNLSLLRFLEDLQSGKNDFKTLHLSDLEGSVQKGETLRHALLRLRGATEPFEFNDSVPLRAQDIQSNASLMSIVEQDRQRVDLNATNVLDMSSPENRRERVSNFLSQVQRLVKKTQRYVFHFLERTFSVFVLNAAHTCTHAHTDTPENMPHFESRRLFEKINFQSFVSIWIFLILSFWNHEEILNQEERLLYQISIGNQIVKSIVKSCVQSMYPFEHFQRADQEDVRTQLTRSLRQVIQQQIPFWTIVYVHLSRYDFKIPL